MSASPPADRNVHITVCILGNNCSQLPFRHILVDHPISAAPDFTSNLHFPLLVNKVDSCILI